MLVTRDIGLPIPPGLGRLSRETSPAAPRGRIGNRGIRAPLSRPAGAESAESTGPGPRLGAQVGGGFNFEARDPSALLAGNLARLKPATCRTQQEPKPGEFMHPALQGPRWRGQWGDQGAAGCMSPNAPTFVLHQRASCSFGSWFRRHIGALQFSALWKMSPYWAAVRIEVRIWTDVVPVSALAHLSVHNISGSHRPLQWPELSRLIPCQKISSGRCHAHWTIYF